MPTYQEILEADFSVLTRAADAWKSAAAKFRTLEDVFAREVQTVSTSGDWRRAPTPPSSRSP